MNVHWCIENYRDSFLPYHQWLLQKEFMEHYQSDYPEDRLVCLSQCYLNVVFLGSTYSDAIMKLLDSLSRNVPLLNQFRNDTAFRTNFIKSCYMTDGKTEDLSTVISSSIRPLKRKKAPTLQRFNSCNAFSMNFVKSTSTFENFELRFDNSKDNYQLIVDRVRSQNGIKGKLILLCKSDPTNMQYTDLYNSANSISAEVKIKMVENSRNLLQNNQVEYELSIGNETICSEIFNADCSTKADEKRMKEVLGLKALNILQDYCFTLQKLNHSTRPVINKTGTYESEQQSSMSEQTGKLTEYNCEIGAKLMRKMGWDGGGLGSKKQGREDIIETSVHINKAGLGTTNIPKALDNLLQEYAKGNSSENLIFSTDFSKEERAQIHVLARRFNLKSVSTGKGKCRQLTVIRVKSKWELIKMLIQNNNENGDYRLIYPKKFNLKNLQFC